MYKQVIASLQQSYNATEAIERDKGEKATWKIAERQHFLALLQKEGKTTLLEVGAGTGTDSKFHKIMACKLSLPIFRRRWSSCVCKRG